MEQQEKPVYVLHKNKTRTIVPKFISFIILGIVFYIGILLNIALLDLTGSEETIIKTIALIFLLLVIVIGAYITFHRAHIPYKFYYDRISCSKKNIFYTNITQIQLKKGLLDKIFKTYTLHIGDHVHIKHIPQSIDIQNYLQQLVAYSKKNKGGSGKRG